ncbi:SET-binding protein [Grus japonensis]|uniref:SET-binding protein n=1 Tax=Grus japonensis TaxID=30415 RepID=A0ABC9Y9A1_GRUJA
MEKGRVKLWMLVTIFCTVIPTIKVLSFLFALENATESDEEFGKRLWVPCAESSDEICEQGGQDQSTERLRLERET